MTATADRSGTPVALTQAEVADRVRRDILSGELVPGQRLVEIDLSSSLGASRGAVRGALIDLTHEGLVERIAHRGARVRAVSLDEAIQIIEVRQALEALCAFKAAFNITPEQAEELRALGSSMSKAVADGDLAEYSRLNQRLDERMIAIADQPVAAGVLARLQAQNVRHQFRLAFRPGRAEQSLPEHLAIIDALCDRDPGAARSAVEAHLESVLEALRHS